MFGGYETFDDPYCYKGRFTLKNKQGLRDIELLEAFAVEMSTLRAKESLQMFLEQGLKGKARPAELIELAFAI